MRTKTALSRSRQNNYLAVKYSLFNTYLATLASSSYPNFNTNNRLSSLRGLTTRAGKKKLNTQRWVWLVGPVWGSWSAWFDSLTMAFCHRGACFTNGSPSTELVSRALTWLTLGQTYHSFNLARRPVSQANLNNSRSSNFPPKAFWLITSTPRRFCSYGAPTFSLSGSNVRSRVGWAVLPGPVDNKGLSKFVFLAALVAYRSSRPL